MGTEQLKLVGYFPKRTAVPEGWSRSAASAHVTEICSVSHCIAGATEGWMDHWLHNEWGFFDTWTDARRVAPSKFDGFAMFAYRLLPARFKHGRTSSLTIRDFPVDRLPAGFVSLGFDVVSMDASSSFECSPLSCNGLAGEVAVNRYCLVEDLGEAMALADRFSREEPEPGPYYVLEVLRQPV